MSLFYDKLIGAIYEIGLTKKEYCENVDIDLSTLYRFKSQTKNVKIEKLLRPFEDEETINDLRKAANITKRSKDKITLTIDLPPGVKLFNVDVKISPIDEEKLI